MKNEKLTFIDIFSGMGTIRLGMEQAGHECVYAIEWDKHKRKIYDVIFGHEPEGRDINDVTTNELPRADVWAFGFPCQDISVAGKQLGFRGHRSNLFFAVTRLIRELKEKDRPKYLLIENVKNFFSINKGYDFLQAQIELDKIGYDAEWQLLNSKNFGVPQNRERVFIVGHLRGRSTRKIFPIEGTNSETLKQVINGSDAQRVYDSKGLARTLKAEGGGQGAKTGLYLFNGTKEGNTYCLEANYAKGETRLEKAKRSMVGVRACITPDRLSKRQNGRRFKENGEPMFTLTGQDRHGVAIYQRPRGNNNGGIHKIAPTLTKHSYEHNNHLTDGIRIRRLTPRECMRLQAVPDYVTDKLIEAGISDTQLYRAAGDGCTVSVIYEIAKRL